MTTEKISIEELTEYITTNPEKLSSIIDRFISPGRIKLLCENIVNSCFEGYKYEPWNYDYAFKAYFLLYYANIKYASLNELESFIYNEDIDPFAIILDYIDEAQFAFIKMTVKEMIDFRKGQILSEMSKDEDLYDVMRNVNECVLMFKSIMSNVSGLVDGLKNEELTSLFMQEGPKVIDAVKNLDQEKMTGVVLDIMEKRAEKQSPEQTEPKKKRPYNKKPKAVESKVIDATEKLNDKKTEAKTLEE